MWDKRAECLHNSSDFQTSRSRGREGWCWSYVPTMAMTNVSRRGKEGSSQESSVPFMPTGSQSGTQAALGFRMPDAVSLFFPASTITGHLLTSGIHLTCIHASPRRTKDGFCRIRYSNDSTRDSGGKVSVITEKGRRKHTGYNLGWGKGGGKLGVYIRSPVCWNAVSISLLIFAFFSIGNRLSRLFRTFWGCSRGRRYFSQQRNKETTSI